MRASVCRRFTFSGAYTLSTVVLGGSAMVRA
jgi:hypothetical protein